MEGDLDAGLQKLRTAVALDPKSSIANSVYAAVLYAAGHEDEALAVCDTIVAIEEEWCPLLKYDVAMARKDYAAARAALEISASNRGAEALALFHAQMDVLDGKGSVEVVAEKLMKANDGQNDPASITPMAGPDVVLWLMALGRNDLAIERFRRFKDVMPHNARFEAFDRHLGALHCEPKFLDILRELKVEEPNLAAACPKTH